MSQLLDDEETDSLPATCELTNSFNHIIFDTTPTGHTSCANCTHSLAKGRARWLRATEIINKIAVNL